MTDFLDDLPITTDDGYFDHHGFNQSTAWQLISKSPMHAFAYRRKQAQGRKRIDPEHSRDREMGTVAHKLLLGSTTAYTALDFDDYRTKDAQQKRAAAELAGITPILQPDLERCRVSVNAVREQLLEVYGIELDGVSERPLFWNEGPVGCKGKPDHICADGVTMLDLKTGEDANPRGLIRRILQAGCHMQAASYLRGNAATNPDVAGRQRFIDIFIETTGLVLCTPVEISGALLELGERQWLRACREWHRCGQEGRYPGYTTTVLRPECPAYALDEEMGHESPDAEV